MSEPRKRDPSRPSGFRPPGDREDIRTWQLLNDFARRSFRDNADRDYIAARMTYRAALYPQFQWSALQAVEKYLKAILLYNRVPSEDVGHHLREALKQAEELPFELKLSERAMQMIRFLDHSARFRYLEASWVVHGPKLRELDRLVWEVRRYCRTINYEIVRSDGTRVSFLESELRKIEDAEDEPFHEFTIKGGLLEKIIEKRDHPARQHLIWQNLYFGSRKRSTVTHPMGFHSENAPLSLHPEILDDVLQYVRFPKWLANAYREELKKRRDDKGEG